MIGDRAADRLADPPRGIGAELEAFGVIEFLHSAQQPDVAFLDQIEEVDAAAHIPFGDADDQAQIGACELLDRRFGLGFDLCMAFGQVFDAEFIFRQPRVELFRRGQISLRIVIAANLHLFDERDQVERVHRLVQIERQRIPTIIASPIALVEVLARIRRDGDIPVIDDALHFGDDGLQFWRLDLK